MGRRCPVDGSVSCRLDLMFSCQHHLFDRTFIYTMYIIKIEIHSKCEIEDCLETHLCKLCVILRSRVSRVVCPHEEYRSATPLGIYDR